MTKKEAFKILFVDCNSFVLSDSHSKATKIKARKAYYGKAGYAKLMKLQKSREGFLV